MTDTYLPICIGGMHRSGTSMVAKLLQACGLYLGPEEELGFDVRTGERHWENVRLVALNQKILNRLGGSWDNPPALPERWERRPEVESLTLPAMKLIGLLSRDHPHWGWKDPRNSLTVRFWRRLIPELTVVICVRNPLEISRSLQTRGDSIAIGAAQLWLTYYRELLTGVPREMRVITHYESYFIDPAAELERLASAINMKVPAETVRRSLADIVDNLRHHRALADEKIGSPLSAEVSELYEYLCSEAGPVYRGNQNL